MLIVILGGYFNVSMMLPNISMTHPIVVVSMKGGLYSHWYSICIKVFMAVSDNRIKETIVSNSMLYT